MTAAVVFQQPACLEFQAWSLQLSSGQRDSEEVAVDIHLRIRINRRVRTEGHRRPADHLDARKSSKVGRRLDAGRREFGKCFSRSRAEDVRFPRPHVPPPAVHEINVFPIAGPAHRAVITESPRWTAGNWISQNGRRCILARNRRVGNSPQPVWGGALKDRHWVVHHLSLLRPVLLNPIDVIGLSIRDPEEDFALRTETGTIGLGREKLPRRKATVKRGQLGVPSPSGVERGKDDILPISGNFVVFQSHPRLQARRTAASARSGASAWAKKNLWPIRLPRAEELCASD